MQIILLVLSGRVMGGIGSISPEMSGGSIGLRKYTLKHKYTIEAPSGYTVYSETKTVLFAPPLIL